MTRSELVEHFKQSSALPDDWYLIDDRLLRSAICEVLPMYQKSPVEYDTLLTGKTAIAYGMTPNEKRWLKRHVEQHNGKFRFTYRKDIDVYIMSSVCSIYDLHIALMDYRNGHNLIVVDYNLFIQNFDDAFDNDKEEEIKAQEREAEKLAKINRTPTYEACTEQDLARLHQTSPKQLNLDDDVFHVIGRTEKALRDAFETAFDSAESTYLSDYSYIGDYYSKNELYDLIAKKGGQYVKKEDSPNITCVIFGSEPSMRHIKMYEGKVKLINAVDAVNWLKNQKDVNPACKVFAEEYKVTEDDRLRPYQQQMKTEVFRNWKRHFNVMLQLPTGTGKTMLFTSVEGYEDYHSCTSKRADRPNK